MGNRYWVKRENHTPTASQDSLTIISPASRRVRVIEAVVGGAGSSSAAQGLVIARAAAGTTPGGGITPSKAEHSEQPNATFTTATTWAAQPTPETNGIYLPFNALGGPFRWTANQKSPPIEARNGEVISIRPPAGVTPQACGFSVLVEED